MPKATDAILQFEIDRERVAKYPRDSSLAEGNPIWKYEHLLKAALFDTLHNGGTFVLIVEKDTITAVQRTTVESLGNAKRAKTKPESPSGV